MCIIHVVLKCLYALLGGNYCNTVNLALVSGFYVRFEIWGGGGSHH